MLCQHCGRNLPDDAAFCSYCGQSLRPGAARRATDLDPPPVRLQYQTSPEAGASTASPPDNPTHPSALVAKLTQEPTRFGSIDPQEEELWHGGFSPKAMYGSFILATAITVASTAAVVLYGDKNQIAWWMALAAGVAIVWLALLLALARRRIGVHYRLTRFRLFHEHGVLTRVTDRLETIDIDDVTLKQTLLQRLLGIGTIIVMSSDRTVPQLRMEGIDHVRHVADLIDNTRRAERQRRGLHLEAT